MILSSRTQPKVFFCFKSIYDLINFDVIVFCLFYEFFKDVHYQSMPCLDIHLVFSFYKNCVLCILLICVVKKLFPRRLVCLSSLMDGPA